MVFYFLCSNLMALVEPVTGPVPSKICGTKPRYCVKLCHWSKCRFGTEFSYDYYVPGRQAGL